MCFRAKDARGNILIWTLVVSRWVLSAARGLFSPSPAEKHPSSSALHENMYYECIVLGRFSYSGWRLKRITCFDYIKVAVETLQTSIFIRCTLRVCLSVVVVHKFPSIYDLRFRLGARKRLIRSMWCSTRSIVDLIMNIIRAAWRVWCLKMCLTPARGLCQIDGQYFSLRPMFDAAAFHASPFATLRWCENMWKAKLKIPAARVHEMEYLSAV